MPLQSKQAASRGPYATSTTHCYRKGHRNVPQPTHTTPLKTRFGFWLGQLRNGTL